MNKPTDEERVAVWWNGVKDADWIWSGAISGTPWADLWDEARQDLCKIWLAAREGQDDG